MKKHYIKVINIFIIIFYSTFSFSQESTPTSTGLGYGKYIDSPVSPFTGTHSYSVPLGSVNSGSLTVPISLSYHGSGNRVGDISSPIGLGWNLNAAGKIMRSIRGQADDDTANGFLYDHTGNYPPQVPEMVAMCDKDKDGESDIYSWILPNGKAGKFVFHRNWSIKHINKTDVKIEIRTPGVFSDGFKITDNDGSVYYFTGLDFQKDVLKPWIIIAFNLSIITSYDNQDTIRFKYKIDPNFSFPYFLEQIYIFDQIALPIAFAPINSSNIQLINTTNRTFFTRERVLEEIIGNNNKVVLEHFSRADLEIFSPQTPNYMIPSRVKSISFLNGAFCVKYNLIADYFKAVANSTNWNEQRLKLQELQKVSCDGTLMEPAIKFEYFGNTLTDGKQFFPKYLDKNIDHWGYYNKVNGEDNNLPIKNMIPYGTHIGNNYNYGNSYRDPNFNSALIGMLKKITLPTKGTIEFTYEQNQYLGNQNTYTPVLIEKNCTQSNPVSSSSLTLNQFMKDYGIITINGTGFDDEDINEFNCTVPNPNIVTLDVINTATSQNIFSQTMTFNGSGTSTNSININTLSQFATGGTYIFNLSTTNCVGQIIFSYNDLGINTAGSGLRIKEVKTSDVVNTLNDVIKTFEYVRFDNATLSSGFLINKPKYTFVKSFPDLNIAAAYSLKSLENIDGLQMGYENVKVLHNGNGFEKYIFRKDNNTFEESFPSKPNQNLSGFELKTSIENASSIMLKDATNLYNPELFNTSEYYHVGTKFPISEPDEIYTFYQLKLDRFISVQKITSISDGVTTISNFEYSPGSVPNIINPVVTYFTNSDNKISRSETKFTSEYDADLTAKTYFVDKNVNIPYKTIVKVDGIELDGSKTNFSSFGGHYKASSDDRLLLTYDGAGVLSTPIWSTQKTYNNYNYRGKLTAFSSPGFSATNLQYLNNTYNVSSQSYSTHVKSFEYFPNSNLLKKKTNIDGTSESYTYDALLRLKTVQDDCELIKKTYDYYFSPTGSSNKHYTKVTTEFLNTIVNSNSSIGTLIQIQYYDNLSRVLQSVRQSQSYKPTPTSTSFDIIDKSYEYDKWGRMIKEYLPVQSINTNGDFVTINGSWSFNETLYESSPLNRVISNKPASWYATTYQFVSNTHSDAVINPATGSNYGVNSLYKTISIDPNGNKNITFKDKKNRTILSRIEDSTTPNPQRTDTYYCYDNKDRLILVIPPGSNFTNTSNLNYYYLYDGEDKLISKTIPSFGTTTFMYNSKDLLGAMTDNAVGTNKWLVYSYDAFGRQIKSGIFNGSSPNAETPTFSTEYTTTSYGTSGIDLGKVKMEKALIMDGGTNYLEKNYTYDVCGKVGSVSGNNHTNITNLNSFTLTFSYDKGTNLTGKIQTIAFKHPSTSVVSSNTITETNIIDHVGRSLEERFKLNTEAITTLSKTVVNHREEIITKYQGKTPSGTGVNEYLQEINYFYKSNGLLERINQAQTSNITHYNTCTLPSSTTYTTYNDKDLFYLELYYDNPLANTTATSRKNGEISSARWQTKSRSFQNYAYSYDYKGQLTNAKYYDYNHGPNLLVATDRYTENMTYDERGNIKTLTRYGVVSPSTCGTGVVIDNLVYSPMTLTQNRITSIADNAPVANVNLGFKPATGSYTYNNAGSITSNPYKGITSILYNHLNLPTSVRKDVGATPSQRVNFLYDATGGLLTKTVIGLDGTTVTNKRDYIGNFEFENNSIESINHGEGRYKFITGTTWRHEYNFTDHLGNTRLVYTDVNANNRIDVGSTEILQESHYYPYGLEFNGSYFQAASYDYRYKFNGIERIKDNGIDYDFTTYRGLDPTIGRWLQVDPKAEAMMGMSPYCAMGNNPIVHTDPNGDILPAILLGAAIGMVSNGIGNLASGNNFFKGAGKATLFGAIGGALSFGIGSIANSAFGASASLGKAAFQMGAHGLTGGTMSASQGGSFTSGLLSGALSSGISSAAHSVGVTGWGMVGLGGLSGGIGSSIGGGSFWRGVGQGLLTSGLNHAAHTGVFGKGLAISLVTGRMRHVFGPDAIAGEVEIGAAAGPAGIRAAKGGVYALVGPNKGKFYSFTEFGNGAGWDAVLGVSATEFYYTGKASIFNPIDHLSGISHMISAGGTFSGIDFGAGVGFANTDKISGKYTNRIYMLSYNVGFTGSPINLSGTYFRNNTIFDE